MAKLFPYGSFWERALLSIKLVSDGPLHIGSGGYEIVKEVLRIQIGSDFRFFVPSNSVKGVLRSTATMIARSMAFDSDTREILMAHRKEGHLRSNNYSIETLRSVIARKYGNEEEEFLNETLTGMESDEERESFLSSLLCPVCRLFGSQGFSSKLTIADMVPSNNYMVGTYTSNAISRKTRIVEEKRLYSIEYVYSEDGVRFELKILADNLSGTDEGKVFANLLRLILATGLRIGGMKSKGYGLLNVDVQNSKVLYASFKSEPNQEQAYSNISSLLFKEGREKLTVEDYANKISQ